MKAVATAIAAKVKPLDASDIPWNFVAERAPGEKMPVTHKADLIVGLLKLVHRLRAERAGWRELATSAIGRTRELTVENAKQAATIDHQREQIRTLVGAEREMEAARQRRVA